MLGLKSTNREKGAVGTETLEEKISIKLRELQQRLSKLDPELDVLCYTEDPKLVTDNVGFRLLDIEDVNTTEGEQVRLNDGTPHLKLGAGPASVTLAILEVTTDF